MSAVHRVAPTALYLLPGVSDTLTLTGTGLGDKDEFKWVPAVPGATCNGVDNSDAFAPIGVTATSDPSVNASFHDITFSLSVPSDTPATELLLCYRFARYTLTPDPDHQQNGGAHGQRPDL